MKELPPNTPVIVGVGFVQEKIDNPLECSEPFQLMAQAIRNAADDAGSAALLTQIDSISVQQGSWKYPNPGKMLGEELGSPKAISVLADLGVLQIGPFAELCQAIMTGEQQLGIVTGGEARYRELRSILTEQPVADTEQPEDTPPPDIQYNTPDPFSSELEQARGVWAPGEFYAIADSAVRHHQGLGIEEYRDKIAKLYSSFSDIAAKNPHAWSRERISAEEIRTPTAKNTMISFPYTKRHMSQWNVNQSAAIIVCSAAKAAELNLDSSGWVFPISVVQSRHVVALAQKKQLHSHPGAVLTGKRAFELAGATVEDLTIADLYSCFPSAIQSFAADLQLPSDLPVSATGSMAYAGGPFNHGGLDSVARVVELLRSGEGQTNKSLSNKRLGLVTNISGMFAKQACALFSNEPNEQGFGFDDITSTVAEEEIALPLDADYLGSAKIVAYSVIYNKGEFSHAIVYCDTPKGARTVVRTDNTVILELMTKDDFCNREIIVLENGGFTLTG